MKQTFKKIQPKDLLFYEMPSCAEYTNIGFIQEMIARYTAWKINRKYERYLTRLERTQMFSKEITIIE